LTVLVEALLIVPVAERAETQTDLQHPLAIEGANNPEMANAQFVGFKNPQEFFYASLCKMHSHNSDYHRLSDKFMYQNGRKVRRRASRNHLMIILQRNIYRTVIAQTQKFIGVAL